MFKINGIVLYPGYSFGNSKSSLGLEEEINKELSSKIEEDILEGNIVDDIDLVLNIGNFSKEECFKTIFNRRSKNEQMLSMKLNIPNLRFINRENLKKEFVKAFIFALKDVVKKYKIPEEKISKLLELEKTL